MVSGAMQGLEDTQLHVVLEARFAHGLVLRSIFRGDGGPDGRISLHTMPPHVTSWLHGRACFAVAVSYCACMMYMLFRVSYRRSARILARSVWAQHVPVLVFSGGTMAEASARKRKLEDLDKRLGDLELRQESQEQRLDRVEYRLEESQSYTDTCESRDPLPWPSYGNLLKKVTHNAPASAQRSRQGWLQNFVLCLLVCVTRTAFKRSRWSCHQARDQSPLLLRVILCSRRLRYQALSNGCSETRKVHSPLGWCQVNPPAWLRQKSRIPSTGFFTWHPGWGLVLLNFKSTPIVVRRRGRKERQKAKARGLEEKGEPVAVARGMDKAENLRSLEAGRVWVIGRGQ